MTIYRITDDEGRCMDIDAQSCYKAEQEAMEEGMHHIHSIVSLFKKPKPNVMEA